MKVFDFIKLCKSQYCAYKLNHKGLLSNSYLPLLNLVTSLGLGDFTTEKLDFDRYTPVDIQTVEEYDGSVNLILNDDKSYPKLINSRFSVQENNTFNIPEHYGNAVTNIYDNDTFRTDALLLKLYQTIPSLTFNGIQNEGNLLCGTYIFYFKLADADGNLTNIVQESSIVQIHIGKEGSSQIRMGLNDENALKSVSFTLSNIDKGFDYVRVFYERTSSDQSQLNANSFWMIDQSFPIQSGKCELLIDGTEKKIQIEQSDIQNEFADILAVKTLEIAHNILFFGNVSSFEQDYKALLKLAWKIIPRIRQIDSNKCGSVIYSNYIEAYPKGLDVEHQLAYYNSQNIYNNVGYWADEYYRLGIVFIYNNNILSPAFNILGIDFQTLPDLAYQDTSDYYNLFFQKDIALSEWDSEPDNYIFDNTYLTNSKGVIRTPNVSTIDNDTSGIMRPRPLFLEFDFSHIGCERLNTSSLVFNKNFVEVLKGYGIKGFFFVRQKRIPSIIALGLVVGLTKQLYGSIPVIQDEKGNYITEGFLNKYRLLRGSTIKIDPSHVTTRAILVPDFETHLATFNLLFTGSKFSVNRVGSTSFANLKENMYSTKSYTSAINSHSNIKLTGVATDVKITTDGTEYFSTKIGSEDDATKTADVQYSWDYTVPLKLTTSTSLIRGRWGAYVGTSSDMFSFGDIVNIKLEIENTKTNTLLEFKKRFKDYSLYSAIGSRYNVSDLYFDITSVETKSKITCYRGDCYQNVFTHRMMANFIDKELPTNRSIVDPACWGKNYAVRCTAIPDAIHGNIKKDNEGWVVDGTSIGGSAMANLIATAFETTESSGKYPEKETDVVGMKYNLINPDKLEMSPLAKFVKSIFSKSEDKILRGVAAINRADVNAVNFGEWITFPICSSSNYAMRDIDFMNPIEEASLNQKRTFYPWTNIDVSSHLLDAETINAAAAVSISKNLRTAFRTIPYIKQEYFNRIYWSKPNVAQSFINSYRFIFDTQYREYNKEFGSIIKLNSYQDNLFIVFQHGLGIVPIQKTPQNDAEASPFLASKSVLPQQVNIISKDYGSMWKDSVYKTPSSGYIYGVDTVAKKIWRYGSNGLQFISDHKVSKFLNENINLSEFDFKEYIGHVNVKTHYNEFKHDVIFTFYKDIPEYILELPKGYDPDIYEIGEDGYVYIKVTHEKVIKNYEYVQAVKKITAWKPGKTWSLCFNEVLNQFITFYDWYPIESCNVDNIFFSFDKEEIDTILENEDPPNFSLLLPVAYDASDSIILFNGSSKKEYSNFYEEHKVLIDKTFGNKIKLVYFTDRLYNIDHFKLYTDESLSVPTLTKNSLYAFSFYVKADEPEKYYPSDPKIPTYELKLQFYDNTTKIYNQLYTMDCSGISGTDIGKWKYKLIFFRTGDADIPLENIVFSKFSPDTIKLRANFELCELKLTLCNLNVKQYKLFFDVLDASKPIDFNSTIFTYTTPFDYYDIRDTQYNTMKIWKHGQAGLFDNLGVIKPTNWYGKQHEFNVEFVVNEQPGMLKVFNNLKIISNKTEPNKFEYEIVGESYDWYRLKPIIQWINDKFKTDTDPTHGTTEKEKFEYWYLEVLTNTYDTLKLKYTDFPDLFDYLGKTIIKLPFLHIETADRKGLSELNKSYRTEDYWDPLRPDTDPKKNRYGFNTSETIIVEDNLLNELRIHTESLGNDMKLYGRVRGNMQYLEDLWDIEIRPINFKWAYCVKNEETEKYELKFIKSKETRHRDKYLKVKVRYSGKDLAVIQAIVSMFDYSFA